MACNPDFTAVPPVVPQFPDPRAALPQFGLNLSKRPGKLRSEQFMTGASQSLIL